MAQDIIWLVISFKENSFYGRLWNFRDNS